MRQVSMGPWCFVPKAIVIPRWLHKFPPFNKLVYCERTYSNDYTSNTWVVVCLMRRRPAHANDILSDNICKAVVYVGSTVQSTGLLIKTMFSPAFWKCIVRDAKHEFKLRK